MRTTTTRARAFVASTALVTRAALVTVVMLLSCDRDRSTPAGSGGRSGTGIVAGKVVEAADDTPQRDVVVRLLPPLMVGKPGAAGMDSPAYSTKTDKDGQFRIETVQAGAYRLSAGDKAIGMAVKELNVEADKSITLTLKLRKLKL